MSELVSSLAPGPFILPDRDFEAYLFDLDGTVYLGDQLLPGAGRLLSHLRERGSRTIFLSNNPTRDPEMYVDKLRKLGVDAEVGDVVNTVVSLVAWLQRVHPAATVFAIAEQPLINALNRAGIRISEDPSEIDIVIASYDRGFDYRKLQIAFDALWQYGRAILVTTNPDSYCPFPDGRGEPDAAAIVAAIEASTGVKCQANAGKPDQIMIDAALGVLDVDVSDCVMVGDRLYTDIRMATNAGMASALVLTGETTLDSLSGCPVEDQPRYILDQIDHLVPALRPLTL